MQEAYFTMLDMCYYELKFAFDGLADEHVWARPAEGLLSVGELAGHVALWEAVKFAGEGKGGKMEPDMEKCRVRSPLVDPRFRYYTEILATKPSEEQLAMTAEQVLGDLLRVHEEAMAHFRASNVAEDTPAAGWPAWFTYGEFLKYAVFHVAYHTGQIYTARHLLGEHTPDN